MNIYKTFSIFIFSILIMLSITACGGEPVAMNAIPVYPDAAVAQAGESTMGDLLVDSLKASAGDSADAEIALYTLPADTAWTDVKGFYRDKITDDWETAAELTNESDVISTMGWSRGSFASEQALIVGYAVDPLAGKNYMVMVLLSE